MNKNEKQAIELLWNVKKSPYDYSDFDRVLRCYFLDYSIDGLSDDIDEALDEFCTLVVENKNDSDVVELVKSVKVYTKGYFSCVELTNEILDIINRTSNEERDGAVAAISPLRRFVKNSKKKD